MTGPEFLRPPYGPARQGATGTKRAPTPAGAKRTVPAVPTMRRSAGTVAVPAAPARGDPASWTAPAGRPTDPAAPVEAAPGVDPRPRSWRMLAVVALVSASLAVGVTGVLVGLHVGGAGSRAASAPASPAPSSAPPATQSMGAIARQVLPSVVSVRVRSGGRTATGSGFVVADGVVVTNAHVVSERESGVQVQFTGEAPVNAEVLGVARADDLAVLRVAVPAGVPPLPLGGAASTVSVGESVIAVGSPLGLAGTVTAGIVSATDRQVRLGTRRATAVQTDASINPGNSGGPLIDTHGRVIGVNTSIATLGGGNIGIGFAIPADRVSAVLRRLGP